MRKKKLERWDLPAYQLFVSVVARPDGLSVLFADNSTHEVPYTSLVGPRGDLVWERMVFNEYEITVPIQSGGIIEIPWTTVRYVTDTQFRKHWDLFLLPKQGPAHNTTRSDL